jgi:hypothetical protein
MDKRIAIAVQRRGKVEQFELAYERLRIGSASHCDVRLAPDEAAAEAVLLEPREGVLMVHALDGELRLHGLAMLAPTVVRERARLELGSVQLTVELSDVLEAKPTSERKTLRQGVMLLGVVTLYAYMFAEPGPESALAHPLMPAPLFSEQGAACQQDSAEAARVFAREQLALADSQRERWPFHMREGVLAVPNYRSAAACFAAAGDERQAKQVSETASALAVKLEEELSAHRVRLEWFLDRKRFHPAVEEVRALRELLAERNDPYARWLAAVAHELQTMQALAKEE